MTKLQLEDMLKLHLQKIDQALKEVTETEHRILLLKERGDTIRQMASLVS